MSECLIVTLTNVPFARSFLHYLHIPETGKMATELFPRYIRARVLEALADTRAVVLVGARQVGKSTLADKIVREDFGGATSVTLDDRITREAAHDDPTGFIADIGVPAFIDEVQRGGPDLLLEIKAAVDRDTRPGRFLLTGSANLLSIAKAYEALTGRAEIVHLWPLTQTEIEGSERSFVDALWAGEPPRVSEAPVGRQAFARRVVAGGYPEALKRSGRRRSGWFAGYVQTIVERNLRELADVRKVREIPRLLRLLAAQSANLFSARTLAGKLDLDARTVRAYCDLLEAAFLIHRLPAWRPGIGAREIRTPKAYVVDSGLLCHLLGANEQRLAEDQQVTGKALESFAVMEILRHAEWAEEDVRAFHHRGSHNEVDLVLESRAGELACVEVKAAASLSARDFRAMAQMRDARPDRFRAGFLLYAGRQTLPFGDRLWAVPISGLWA